jgi:hypothetical protein
VRDNSDLDYREVLPRLQRIRGPYPMAAGVTAHVKHASGTPGHTELARETAA